MAQAQGDVILDGSAYIQLTQSVNLELCIRVPVDSVSSLTVKDGVG